MCFRAFTGDDRCTTVDSLLHNSFVVQCYLWYCMIYLVVVRMKQYSENCHIYCQKVHVCLGHLCLSLLVSDKGAPPDFVFCVTP